MIIQVLHCPYCQGTDIVRHGQSPEGKQRYRCRECREGRGRTFLLDYSYAGQSPEVKQQIVEMAMNASGVRDTARVLNISPTTMDVLPGMNAGVSIFATPSPIEGSRVAEEDVGRLGIEPGAPNAYPSPP